MGIAEHFVMLAVLVASASAFYLPGVNPYDYEVDEEVKLKVNSMNSLKTHLAYNFYDLPYCKPEGGVKQDAESLGEYLTGNRIENSAYEIQMRKREICKVLCRKMYAENEINLFRDKIKLGYYNNWIIDNLPAATEVDNVVRQTYQTLYNRGFNVGQAVTDPATNTILKMYLNNHVKLNISYHIPDPEDDSRARIVGLVIDPFSIDHKYSGVWKNNIRLDTCDYNAPADPLERHGLKLDITEPTAKEVIWTYDVIWSESEVRWATRWDVYLNVNSNDDVHIFSIVNALLIILFLTGMVGMIMLRTLHRDINRYNRIPTEEERDQDREETGWKLVHADVFRPPHTMPMLLCVLVGTGVQLFVCMGFTLVFAAIGFLSPANRGSLMIAMLLLFVLMGSIAGYHSARTFKMFKGKQWQRCTIATATLFPGTVFAVFLFLDICEWIEGSVTAVPISGIFALMMLWMGISIPLTFVGAFVGYRKETIEFPVNTSNIPRPIPEQPWYMGAAFSAMVGGVLPFGAVFVELFFILTSIWLDQYYYVFGFLFVVFVILVITCAEITIVLCYFQLCSEDYRWWWRSFLTSGASGLYVFLYSAYYFFTTLAIENFLASMMFFMYMFLVSFAFTILTGTVGFMSCLWFNKQIYGSIKVD